MKKLLLSIVALLGVMNASAQVTETDLSGYDYAIYAGSLTVSTGTTAQLPIYMKNAASVASLQFSLVLPGDLADTYSKAGLNAARFNADNGGTVFDANKQEDGSVMVIATVIHDDGFSAGDAPICYLNLPISKTMAAGEYPIIVKATELSGINGVGSESKKIDAAITSKLTVLNYILLDETSTVVPEAAAGVDVLVKRTIKANEWSTICLPFAMTEAQVKNAFGDDVELGDFKGYEYDEDADHISVKFDNATAVEANHPYIIKVASAISEFNVEGVDIAPDEDLTIAAVKRTRKAWSEMTGTYVAGTVLEESTLFLNDNKFWYSTGSTKMKAFRAYFDFYDELENKDAANNVKISFDDATGIKNIQASENAPFYTLDGKLMGKNMNRLPKGVYIQNGKKVVK